MQYLKVFTDFKEFMEPLNDEEKGRLFVAMLDYAQDGSEPRLEGNERFVWAMAKRIIDREAAAYESKVNSASKARSSRWKQASDIRADALESEPIPLVSDKEKEYEKDKDKEKENEKEEENSKESLSGYVCVSKEKAAPVTGPHTPERAEVETYCRERNNGIDPDYFYDYYAAKGWKVGQDPMQDWRAMVRTWERKNAREADQSGDISGAVQGVLNMARRNRTARQRRDTFDNYKEEPSRHFSLDDIALTLDDEL